jgi:hypothetical protein
MAGLHLDGLGPHPLGQDWDRLIPGHPDSGGRLGIKQDAQDQLTLLQEASAEMKKLGHRLKTEQVKRLKELELENSRLRKAVWPRCSRECALF